MSWLWGTPTIAKIFPKEAFYYITPEHVQKGWFKISNWNTIQVIDRSVEKCPEKGQFVVVPRAIIDKINPRTDFTATIRICMTDANGNGETKFCKAKTLMEIMPDNVTFGNAEQMTWAMMVAGECCANMDERILVIPTGLWLPKFTCKNIVEEICRCMNQSVSTCGTYGTSEMVMESKEHNTSIVVTIGLSDGLKKVLQGNDVGSVKLSEKTE